MQQHAIFASIITIGDELLIGQTIDTNSAWMAQELNKIGVWVKRRVAVGDTREDIWQALDEESESVQIILITGGLGPTADDITKPLLCDYFGGKMVVDEMVLEHVTNIFRRLNRPIIDRNMKQAEVPDVCTVLMNKRGTAPGMLFRKGNCIYISMPGVPHEMKGIMTDEVLPLLKREYKMPFILHRTLLTAGVGESFIAEKISAWEERLPADIKLAYLPNYGMVRLRLTATGTNKDQLDEQLDRLFAELQDQVKEWLIVAEDLPLEQALGQLLLSKKKTMATAESCSGGYIAHLITAIPGSSEYFKGTVVAYAYDVKEDVLGVQHSTLETKGAVSEETVTEMLTGLLQKTTADYGIATSGIMGPGGGTTDKPVGTVWVAVGSRQKMIAKRLHFRFDRLKNIELTATNALLMLFQFIEGETDK
ncbi:CinA family nicotinamide mononucleotide deamidase-related protein [Lacibacter sp.]|uniref:CinA family nicotinamide mononucleotide deamidase-related protein n=1 Tax=Lacibacter sp. TaxID=1915409 RepID=UPI002B4B1AEB|nr:CinA family nicotinamide mononucleotide deamidase-related protein [Lacibacter sp.]HLP39317.1 CinA family nicotinamide mononucleotide deamidase-related protein [Lacibacter sp.]